MLNKILYALIVLTLSSSCLTIERQTDEPICTSRFDYDYKMLQKLILLEIENNKLKDMVGQLSEILEDNKGFYNQLRSKLDGVDSRLKLVETVSSLDGSGSTFVRWGRTECPGNGTELVYKGYAGGSHYNNKGAASSYLCLPEDPLWDVYEDKEQSGGTVWGAEYDIYDRSIENFFGKKVLHHDVPCCVCRTKRASVVTVPGRNVCYDGWTLEYSGYLTGGHDTQHASDFVCLDREPEIIKGGASADYGKLFYFIESRCGSLKCPPYVNGRELTCAVCSK